MQSAATSSFTYLSFTIGPRLSLHLRGRVISAWSTALEGLWKDHGTIQKEISRLLDLSLEDIFVAAILAPAHVLQQQQIVIETRYVWKHSWNYGAVAF
jgi:hypothetical protein